MAENQKERIMRILRCTSEEADQILADDKAIDRGERMSFDLPIEKEKEAKKMANVTTKKRTAYNFDTSKRQRKENATKGSIIAELAQFLTEKSENACENVQITNKERQISFIIGTETYELTLVQKRKPK